MELKLILINPFILVVLSSNRTFMELKCGNLRQSERRINVLIVPLWN